MTSVPPRLDEVPSLRGEEDRLAGLHITDVFIRQVPGDPDAPWFALVALTDGVCWDFHPRPTEAEMRAVVEEGLRGMLDALDQAGERHPSVDAEPWSEAQLRARNDLHLEWLQHARALRGR